MLQHKPKILLRFFYGLTVPYLLYKNYICSPNFCKMIKRNKAIISKFIIHKVGNKFNEATNVFSEKLVTFDED